jgi:hypothetical protein
MRFVGTARDFNWRYAVGEVFLIVIGVTIALAGSSWYEGRKDLLAEKRILQQLHQTLEEDLADLTRPAEDMQRVERDVTALLVHLESDKPYIDDLGSYFGSLGTFRGIRFRSAPFEALKAQGLDVISDESLRLKLISLYEDDLSRLVSSSTVHRTFVQERVSPYLMMNFRQLESLDWVPHDYERIRSDGYLANMCRNRLSSLRKFNLPHYDAAMAAMREILDDIESELDD